MARPSRPRTPALVLGPLVLASLHGCFEDPAPVSTSGDDTGTTSSTGRDDTSAGTTADAENHVAMTSTCTAAMHTSWRTAARSGAVVGTSHLRSSSRDHGTR